MGVIEKLVGNNWESAHGLMEGVEGWESLRWWGTIESAHGLMEGVEGWESLRWAGGEQLKVLTA